jgi:hypothetical protein
LCGYTHEQHDDEEEEEERFFNHNNPDIKRHALRPELSA